MKSKIIIFSTMVNGVFGSLYGKTTSNETPQPNIILFVADDHGTDGLGCYGNRVIKTPNLDLFAQEGIRFTNAFCTSASSTASRSVILTGKYSHATGSYGLSHDYHHFSSYSTILSLPVILKNEGYSTTRIGKYHVAPESVYKFDNVLEANPRSTLEMADKCLKVLESKNPFFLYFCTDDPHRGDPFKPKEWNLPNSFGNISGGYPGEKSIVYDPKDVIVPSFLPDTKESREELAQYYQSVSRIDQGFGWLMQLLKQSGKADNTIVIYISDNGIAFPGSKTTLYEPGIKLPCIIKTPQLKTKGHVNNAMINWTDITPTILDMAGVDIHKFNFHGRSFKTILDQTDPVGWDENYASHTFHEVTMYYPMRVYQDRRYKLIWNIAWRLEYPFAADLWASSTWQGIIRNKVEYYGKRKVADYINRPEFELYDMIKDPDEIRNLVNNKAFAPILEIMKQKIQNFQIKTNDPWFIMWNHDTLMQGTGVNL